MQFSEWWARFGFRKAWFCRIKCFFEQGVFSLREEQLIAPTWTERLETNFFGTQHLPSSFVRHLFGFLWFIWSVVSFFCTSKFGMSSWFGWSYLYHPLGPPSFSWSATPGWAATRLRHSPLDSAYPSLVHLARLPTKILRWYKGCEGSHSGLHDYVWLGNQETWALMARGEAHASWLANSQASPHHPPQPPTLLASAWPPPLLTPW